MTAQEKWENYLFHLKYVVVRNTEHHFAAARIRRSVNGNLYVAAHFDG